MYDIKILPDTKNIIFEKKKGKEDTLASQLGNIIKATVTNVENKKASLYVNENFSFEADLNKLKTNVKAGDELLFEVVKTDKNTFALKQVSTAIQTQNRKQLSKDEMMELFKKQGMYQEDIKTDDAYVENQKKAAEAVSRIKHKIKGIKENATHSAINELIASGLSLEKMSLDMLSSVVKEAESKGRIERHVNKEREVHKMDSPKNEPNEEHIDLKEILENHGLNENKQNITRLESVMSKWKEIKEFNDDAIVSLLRLGRKLTLENIYKAKYSILSQGNNALLSANMNNLENEIQKVLEREGFPVSSENMDMSKLLVGNDIPLTADNLNKALFLRDIGGYDLEKLLNLACENIKNNKRASDIEIFSEEQNEAYAALLSEYDKAIETLPKVTTKNIEHAIRTGRDLTIRNLISMNLPRAVAEPPSDEAITAKRRLVEIQFKLTSEAALRLANKNININTMPIQEALETLKHMERQTYEKSFKVMGVSANQENIDEITDLYDKVKSFKPVSNNVFGDIITRKVAFSVNGVHESSSKITDNYESAGTKVSPKYGDSFSKVRGQFSDLLNKLGIEATEENIKAAVILSRNDIEVNEENILRVTNIDSKINAVYDRLHPYIAVDMIKNNMNPTNMHIDEVLEYIDKFNGAYGTGIKDRVANYIMELDNANIISDMTREAMVAVYRMLSTITKDESVGLGVSIKKDSDMTLGNLFSDAKYFQRTKSKKTDIDIKVDDKSEQKVRRDADDSIMRTVNSVLDENLMGKTENNIKMGEDAVENGGDERNRYILKNERLSLLLNEITLKANSFAFGKVIEENPNFMDLPLTEITKLLEEKSEAQAEPVFERYANIINEINDIPPQVIRWMEENNIPATINNMFAASNMLKKPHFIADKLNETKIADEMELSSIFDEDDLLERLPALSEALPQLAQNDMSVGMAERINIIQNAIRLQNFIHQRPGNDYFQIPVKLHDKIGGVNMYVLNENIGNSEDVMIYMSLDTTNLGNVSMYINVTGDEARIRVCVPDQTSLKRLQNSKDELIGFVENAGFNISKLIFDVESEKNIFENEVMPVENTGKPTVSEFEFAV